MQIEVKELDSCHLAVHYEADPGQILDKRGAVLDYFKKAPVPGFRKGKASIDAIKLHYKSQIDESLKRALAEDAYHNTLFEKKLKPHGAPKFTASLLIDGKFSCDFELYTKPSFELAPYKDLEIPKPHPGQSVLEMTESLLQEIRMRFGASEPYGEEDFVQKNDNIILNYEGSVNGEKIPVLCAEGETLTVGASLLKDFDDNLMGMKLGETRNFTLVVPANGLPSLAGKTIDFTVTLVMGSKNSPCALDDELALKTGKKDFNELKEYIKELSAVKVKDNEHQALVAAVSERLTNDNKFSVPSWISLSEAKYLANNAKLNWDVLSDVDREKYLFVADRNSRLSLILDKIRDEEPEAQLSDQEVFDMIKQKIVQSQPKEPIDEIMKNMTKTGYLQILFQRIKDEYVLDFVIKSSKIVE